ncbi:MAG: GcrA cell cycle regulator [Alphaproteobacteria bacterium]|nr:GcrA cell cycle regulator [Alphaproteobacteria bacterium]
MAWTDEMIVQLKKMWDDGLTTGEIGRRLNVSKNSVVGKVHRLGLSGRPSPIKKKNPEAPATPKPKAEKQKVVNVVPQQKTKPEKKIQEPKPVASPKPEPIIEKEPEIKFIPTIKEEKTPSKAGQNVSLVELDNHTCRWPIGDPKDENFHFCGNKVRIGQTYCDEHAAIAYVKPNKK